MREVFVTSIFSFKTVWPEIIFFRAVLELTLTIKDCFVEGWSWFKFNNLLALVLGKIFKFCNSLTKRLKGKFRMFLKAIQMFGKVTGDKNVGGGVVSLYPSHPG